MLRYTIDGKNYVDSVVPTGASLREIGNSLELSTGNSTGEPVWVTWRMPLPDVPQGPILGVDALICGQGTGDFWEVYGPSGSEPQEYEATPPGDNGCWTFHTDSADDLSVIASVMLRSSMTVDRVEFVITLAASASAAADPSG